MRRRNSLGFPGSTMPHLHHCRSYRRNRHSKWWARPDWPLLTWRWVSRSAARRHAIASAEAARDADDQIFIGPCRDQLTHETVVWPHSNSAPRPSSGIVLRFLAPALESETGAGTICKSAVATLSPSAASPDTPAATTTHPTKKAVPNNLTRGRRMTKSPKTLTSNEGLCCNRVNEVFTSPARSRRSQGFVAGF